MNPIARGLGVLLGTACLVAWTGCAGMSHRTSAPSAPSVDRDAGEGDGDIPDKPVITRTPATTPLRAPLAGTNKRVNSDSSGRDQNETTLAVSQANPLVIIGGANDARLGHWGAGWYSSRDGGATWTDGVMAFQKYSNQGDPTAAVCGDGTIVFGYLDYVGAYQSDRLVVTRSTDGGLTWLTPGVVQDTAGNPFADKPYIACAPAGGTYGNRVYISWTQFALTGSSPIRTAFSTDYGATWTGAKNVSGGGVQGSVPVAGTNGLAYVFWYAGGTIAFVKSTNGGGTWSTAAAAASINAVGDRNFRRNSFPTAAIDRTSGTYANNVYVAWADSRNGDPDIYFARSTNGGTNWSAPLRVNDDAVGNGRDQFFPWMAVDENGLVHLMWLDMREDAGNAYYHVYVATSHDGGQTFDESRKVTDVASNGALTGFLGDYSGLGAGGGKIVPLWSDLRAGTGEEDAYLDVVKAYAYDGVNHVNFLADRTTLTFDDQEPRVGTGINYDVVSGDVADLAGGTPWTAAACAANDLATPPATLADVPAAGHATYYIVRAQGPRGNGSYGSGTAHPDPREGFNSASPCN